MAPWWQPQEVGSPGFWLVLSPTGLVAFVKKANCLSITASHNSQKFCDFWRFPPLVLATRSPWPDLPETRFSGGPWPGPGARGGTQSKGRAWHSPGKHGYWALEVEVRSQKHDESTPIASGSKWSQLRRQQRMTSARKQYEFCECRLFTALQAPRGGKSNNAAKRLKNARHGNETQRSNMRLIDNGRATLRFPHGHIFGAALEWARSGRLHLVHLMGELVHSLRGGGCDVRGKGPPGREELLRGDFFCKKGARGTAVGPLCLPLPIIPGPK
eukprot:gene8247-biopygen21136